MFIFGGDRSDFPVAGRPHSYASPTIYEWEGVESGYFSGERAVMSLRFSSRQNITHYVLGGAHLTSNSFLPTTLLKDLTGTEYSGALDLAVLRDMTDLKHFNDLQDFNYRAGYSEEVRDRLSELEDVEDMEPFVPWFLSCNRARFPYWFGLSDPRNKQLHTALTDFFR